MATRASAITLHESLPANCGERDACVTAAVYSTVEAEYRCVRERVGLQDLSYYGKIAVSGDEAMDLVNHLILADLARLPINQVQASFMLDEHAKPVCDLLIANMGSHYLLLSEGMAPSEVAARLSAAQEKFPGAIITNRSDSLGLLSVDGPYSWELLKVFLGLGVIGTRYREVVGDQMIGGVETTLVRAGKTGEYGYLLICDSGQTIALWEALKKAGEKFELLPIGYRAVDICKVENRVYSQHAEGAAVENVLELNTRTMFGRDKDDFVGRPVLEEVMQCGLARRIVGVSFSESLDVEPDEIAPGAHLSSGGAPIGSLVNAAYSYALKRWIGLALIKEEYACVGVDYGVATKRGIALASTVSAPFLFNKSMSIRPQEDSYFA
jgi:aminomethyltransferase